VNALPPFCDARVCAAGVSIPVRVPDGSQAARSPPQVTQEGEDDRVSGTDADRHDDIYHNGSSWFGGNTDSAETANLARVLINAQIAAPLFWTITIGCPKKRRFVQKTAIDGVVLRRLCGALPWTMTVSLSLPRCNSFRKRLNEKLRSDCSLRARMRASRSLRH